MKYQSELINEILEQRGHEKSSLHYESECIEQWIDENRGAYPKLCDYQSEWLNYIEENPIGKFPYETITNVTEATVDNVVPFAYKSAILSGQTLVNLIKGGDVKKEITYSSGTKARYYFNKSMLKANVDYLLIYEVTDFSGDNALISFNENNSYGITQSYFNKNGIHKTKVNFSDVGAFKDFIIFYKTTGSSPGGFINNVMLVEYQEGMENWDIPYFEGMQSVRMPTLTTSNGDGTKTNILTVNEEVELRGIGVGSNRIEDELDCLTGELTQRIVEVVLDGSEEWLAEVARFTLEGVENLVPNRWSLLLSDKYASYAYLNSVTEYDSYIIGNGWSQSFHIRDVSLFPDPKNQLSEFKQYLSQNPITVQYQLATESIKTVELSVTNQDGETLAKLRPIEGTMNIATDGAPLKPTISMEIPVEATTQNLMSFIEE